MEWEEIICVKVYKWKKGHEVAMEFSKCGSRDIVVFVIFLNICSQMLPMWDAVAGLIFQNCWFLLQRVCFSILLYHSGPRCTRTARWLLPEPCGLVISECTGCRVGLLCLALVCLHFPGHQAMWPLCKWGFCHFCGLVWSSKSCHDHLSDWLQEAVQPMIIVEDSFHFYPDEAKSKL